MKSLVLSAVVGLGTLGGLLCSAAPAQAGPLLWFLVARRVVNGPPYVGYYYEPPVYSYYNGPYPVPAAPAEPAPTPSSPGNPAPAANPASTSPPTLQTFGSEAAPGETVRYQYYTRNGWQMCYDRQTGEYWYLDPASREWKHWTH